MTKNSAGETIRRYFIVGGAGFIGSHAVDYLLSSTSVSRVTIFDNFSSGQRWHLRDHLSDQRLKIVEGDAKDKNVLRREMNERDVIIHLASNPDIARAAVDPEIDFREGTALTQNVLEAMRITGAKRLLYASGSGIYGDLGDFEIPEDFGPLLPISTYGASKLAGEALISAYCHMFDLSACVFRFANVVGPRQTHGICYDFVRKLLSNPNELSILGDGTQSKSYVHVRDALQAVFIAANQSEKHYEVYNVATRDYVTVKEIADLTVNSLGLSTNNVQYKFTTGRSGWKGDIPVVRFNTERIRKLGWIPRMSSREAISDALSSLISDSKQS